MRVRIDDARRDDAAPRVDFLLRGRAVHPRDPGDPAILNRDIDAPSRQAGTVDDIAIAHDQVVFHCIFSRCSPAGV